LILWLAVASLASVAMGGWARAETYTFERLGETAPIRALDIDAVTQDREGHFVAWGGLIEPFLGGCALIGVRTDNGEALRRDLSKYGEGKITVRPGADGNVYVYAGAPARFFRYDVRRGQLQNLGAPERKASYFAQGALARDGRFYVGTFPTASLVCCDTHNGKIENLGRLPTDSGQCYIYPSVAVSDDGVVYAPVGLRHMELWSFEPSTGAKRQILPAPLTRLQGSPRVWTGADGQVYGRAGVVDFLCQSGGVQLGKTARARGRPALWAGDERVGAINDEGKLRLDNAKTGKTVWLPTQYEGRRDAIFSIGCQRDGRIYGSCALPGRSFCYDTRAGRLCDLGVLGSGRSQVYDTISLSQGLFLGSYMGAYVDFYDPGKPIEVGGNPRQLGHAEGQERPIQWCLGPDGMLYAGTEPAKGRLGGALIRVNPRDLSLTVWPSPIPNQSVEYVAPVPERGELFCVTSIQGGTSAIPSEKEAFAFLWDVKKEAMVFKTQPVPGAREYGRVVRAGNGLIYGVVQSRYSFLGAKGKYYIFDPKSRTVTSVNRLAVRELHFPQLNDEPVGPRGLIYGLGDDALFAIDPANGKAQVIARHKTIARAHGFYVTQEGTLYYGSGATLMRCNLAADSR